MSRINYKALNECILCGQPRNIGPLCSVKCQSLFIGALRKQVAPISFPNIGRATPTEMHCIYVRGLNWEHTATPGEDQEEDC